jgi:hypothetical protein
MTTPPTPVYSKSNPNAGGEKMPPGAKRLLIIISALIAAAAIGGVIWGAVADDQFGNSANGCVNVNVAGSTGGELIHKCGNDARVFCRAAYAAAGTADNRAAQLARPQCQAAGWTRARVGVSG